MKRILVVTSDVPFVFGGHRVIAYSLVNALRREGHAADILLTPQNRFGRQFSAYIATRLTDVEVGGDGRRIDQVISLRFPSYAVRHPAHICWLNHRMREYYDLWEAFSAELSFRARLKERARRWFIHRLDRRFLGKLTKLYAQSETIRKRLEQFGGIESEVLYPPPPFTGYRTDDYQNFIFTAGRLHPLKRVRLLIEALAYTARSDVKCLIAGDGPEREELFALVRELGLERRVRFLGLVNEQELIKLYATCRVVFYGPYHEDYGLVTIEALRSRKPVITLEDSGGPTELIKDGESGFILPPDPKEIARKIDLLSEDKELAITMGIKGYEDTAHITWEEALKKLVIV
ncbi:MAG: glycosyltransferase family 4 protein [Acidobacteria bacterium]|nr:glycosyltransferase family 4 protein [Acidobacteriota bacterium]